MAKSKKDLQKARENLINYYYEDYLLKAMSLLSIYNLPKNKDGITIPQRTILRQVFEQGQDGIVEDPKEGWMATIGGGPYGVTVYPDRFTHYVYAAPTAQGGSPKLFNASGHLTKIAQDKDVGRKAKIGEKAVLWRCDDNMRGLKPILEYYAEYKADLYISLKMAIVNSRAANMPVVDNQETADSVKEYWELIQAGANSVIIDRSFSKDAQVYNIATELNPVIIKTLQDCISEVDREFWAALGVEQDKQKKERMVVDEVDVNNRKDQIMIVQILRNAQEACAQISELAGTDTRAELSVGFKIIDGDDMDAPQTDKNEAEKKEVEEDDI